MRPTPRAVFPSLGRAGLGNMLFPYARAVALSEQLGTELLEPNWWRPRLGPLLRNEHDKRAYDRILARPGVARSLATSLVLASHRKITEEEYLESRRPCDDSRTIIVTKGMNGYFQPLHDFRFAIVERIHRLFAPAISPYPQSDSEYVGVHVRRGDFQPVSEGRIAAGQTSVSTPLDWFVELASAIREQDPRRAILVASDGTNSELSPLLAIPGVQRLPGSNPVQDMWILSGSTTILGSGSTFSAWAAFLGGASIAFYPHQNFYLRDYPRAHEIRDPNEIQKIAAPFGTK